MCRGYLEGRVPATEARAEGGGGVAPLSNQPPGLPSDQRGVVTVVAQQFVV